MNTYTLWAKKKIDRVWIDWIRNRNENGYTGRVTANEFQMAITAGCGGNHYPVSPWNACGDIILNMRYVLQALRHNGDRWSRDKRFYPTVSDKIILIDNIVREYSIKKLAYEIAKEMRR